MLPNSFRFPDWSQFYHWGDEESSLLSTWFTRVSLLAVDTRVAANEANDGAPPSEKVPIAERVTKWQKSWKILTIARAACNTMQRSLTMFPLIRSFRPWDHGSNYSSLETTRFSFLVTIQSLKGRRAKYGSSVFEFFFVVLRNKKKLIKYMWNKFFAWYANWTRNI